MDRYLEAFDAGERARLAGNYRWAVLRYGEAARRAYESPSADHVELHLQWGSTLLHLDPGLAFEGKAHLLEARRRGPHIFQAVAIDRELSHFFMLKHDMLSARTHIGRALAAAAGDPAERGASLGYLARYRVAQGNVAEALELFGTADVLLQRGENRHYELDNLMHFLHFLVEFRLGREDDNAERGFVQVQTARLISLAERYGGPPHRERAALILSDAFANVEA